MEQISIKKSAERQSQYFDYLIDPNVQGVNRLFVLSFEDEEQRASYKRHYPPTVEIKNYNATIDGQNFFDQPVRNNLISYDSIQKIATVQGDDYTTGYLLDFNYFKTYYKMIAIDVAKQQAFNADSKAMKKLILLEI